MKYIKKIDIFSRISKAISRLGFYSIRLYLFPLFEKYQTMDMMDRPNSGTNL